MQPAPELIIRNAELPSLLRRRIESRILRLCERYSPILRCRTTVEGPGPHHRQGRFQLRIRITLPGGEIEVSRRSGREPEIAVREAFDAARRRVADRLDRLVDAHRRRPR